MLPLTGCVDDFLDEPAHGPYPEGYTNIQASLDFEPFASKSQGGRGVPGNAMTDLDDLCLVAYDLDGNLMEGFPMEITKAKNNLKVEMVDRLPGDASNGKPAETKTNKATFNARVPYGHYYLYAVANLGQTGAAGTTTTLDELMSGGRYAEAVKKRADFLGTKTQWDEKNWLNNREMLGFFSVGRDEKSPSTGGATNDRTVSVDKPGITLYSWLRRCAAKVTIDFDGSGLRDNIYIYIRRATIHDIPTQCTLGNPSAANSEKEIITYKGDDYRPVANTFNFINYTDEADYLNWPRISNGAPYILENGQRKNFHDENAEAMYLYENMQGDTENDKTNKEQTPSADGAVIGADEKKDNVEFGSYIEVEAYYDHTSSSQVSKGKIIYRFMLGKDALKNFDVERNHHYKITLCIRGNGNDVDWHIEYSEDDGFEVRNPYYISYLYNHDSTMRFRYTPPEGKTVKSLTAEIVGNNWWPDESNASHSDEVKKIQNPLTDAEMNDPLHGSFSRNIYDAKTPGVETDLIGRRMYLGNGFLSLRATTQTTVTYAETSQHPPYNSNTWQQHAENAYMNDRYFYGLGEVKQEGAQPSGKRTDRSKRTYYFDGTPDDTNTGREAYEITKDENSSLRINIPMFTRAKNLVKETGYTGNNPYESSSRSAYVKITVTHNDGTTANEIIRVEQVPRITNPKGIYRRSGNNENFHVQLAELDSKNPLKYIPVESDGPWMAEVIGDNNFINLNGKATIKGGTGSEVQFMVRFNKMNRDKKVRNAIIRVRYHNYSCVHLIFVRQGYSSQAIESTTQTEWHTFNQISKGLEADDPRDEGSLFKFGNIDDAIDAASNANSKSEWTNIATSDFKPAGSLSMVNSAGEITGSKKWGDFNGKNDGFASDVEAPTMAQINAIYRADNMQQGFGVLYADGATETSMTVNDAIGWYRRDTDNAKRDSRGMEGVFVYYWNRSNKSDTYNCRNIFLPLGRAGYGHRRHYDVNKGDGTLRYACGRNTYFPSPAVTFMPLFYDLWMRKGAIYWAGQMGKSYAADGTEASNGVGLDLNFFNFDVNHITIGNVRKHSQWSVCSDETCIDAARLRCVGHQVHPKD